MPHCLPSTSCARSCGESPARPWRSPWQRERAARARRAGDAPRQRPCQTRFRLGQRPPRCRFRRSSRPVWPARRQEASSCGQKSEDVSRLVKATHASSWARIEFALRRKCVLISFSTAVVSWAVADTFTSLTRERWVAQAISNGINEHHATHVGRIRLARSSVALVCPAGLVNVRNSHEDKRLDRDENL